MPLKVGIDISSMHPLSRSRGIGFYTEHLFEALKKYTDINVTMINNGEEKAQAGGRMDLIHYPFFDLFVNTLKVEGHPAVITIHDVIPLIFPKHYPPGIRGRIQLIRQKSALKKVDAIITVSESSKVDITKYLGVDPEKIFVIPSAAGENFGVINDKDRLDSVRDKYSLPDSFVLYSGGVNWNKNLINLTQACLEASMDLVMVGKGFETKNDLHHPELEDFRKFQGSFSGNPKVHILGFVSKEDLEVIYNLALTLLLPSRYEGFGLPILEAQASGLTVITSNVSSMPEVAGDGALLVDPDDVDEITRAVRDVSRNQSLRRDLIKKGFDNVKNFTWRKTALETVKVYERLF